MKTRNAMCPKKKPWFSLVKTVFVGFLLWGCTGNRQQPPDQVPTRTSLPQVETQTSLPLTVSISSIPLTATLTPSPTSAETSTATDASTPTPTHTLTPLPTLPLQVAEEFVKELYETNRGCLLPCWWGMTPGQTSWGEARQFLARFAAVDPYGSVNQINPNFYIAVMVPVPEEVFHIPLSQIYQVKDGIVTSIDISTGYATPYKLSAFLETYGPPGEIWLSTYSTEYPAGVLPFLAVLFYPKRGIFAIYGPQQAEIVGSVVRACQWDIPPSGFGLWSPDQQMTFMDAARHFRMNPDEPGFLLLPLEEATGKDIQTFYKTFKTPASMECLETPKELWPEQF